MWKKNEVAAALALGAASLLVSSHGLAQSAKPKVEEVIVTGHRPGEAAAASKTQVSALENPQAISVVSADLIERQSITRLADALRNVAGVSRSSTYGFFDSYQIRGYDAAYGSLFLDGLKNGNVAGELNELGGLEQVEVIKGPASGLFGAAPLGGVINLVSKRPQATSFTDVSFGTGSYDAIEASLDANGALIDSGALLGRLNLVYKDKDEFVDYSAVERIYVAPALTWQMADDTRLTLLTRYQRDRLSPWSPLSAYGTILPNPNGQVPVTFAVNDDNERAWSKLDSTQLGYEFQHRFSQAIRLTQNLRYERSKDAWDRWMFAGGIDETQTTIGRLYYGPFRQTTRDLGVDTRLSIDMSHGSVRHAVLVGVDYARSKDEAYSAGLYDPVANPLPLFRRDYSLPLVPPGEGEGTLMVNSSRQVGFYVQDHVSIGRFTVTLGGRWDNARSAGQEDDAFSPTVGVTWALTPALSWYANVAESFTPTPSWQTRTDGSLLPPETGKNIETGVKVVSEALGLTGMVSLFQLTRENVATEDPANPFFYIVTGEQRSRGLEVEAAWAPVSALDLRLAYSYIDAEVTKDTRFPVGMPLPNVPKHNLSLWGEYIVQAGPLANLGVSLGVLRNTDKRFYDSGIRRLPGYTLLDWGLSYRHADWVVQLSFTNALDERFFPDACCLDRVTPGEPRAWQLRVKNPCSSRRWPGALRVPLWLRRLTARPMTWRREIGVRRGRLRVD